MSQEENQRRLEKLEDALLRNKHLPDEELEDVFAGFLAKDLSYLQKGRRGGRFRLPWMR